MDYDVHFVDNIVDESVDVEKIFETIKLAKNYKKYFSL